MAIGQHFDAQHQSHQISRKHHLGGIPAGSCGSLLDDLIREKEKRMALL